MEKYVAQDLISAGFFSDISPDAIPKGGFSQCHNAHIFANKMTKTGGTSNISNCPSRSVPGHIMFLSDDTGKIWISAGAGQPPDNQFNPPPSTVLNFILWSWDGSINVDRTPVGVTSATPIADPWNFTSCIFSGMAIFNHMQTGPLYLEDIAAANKFKVLPWDDTQDWTAKGNSCYSIGQFKNFLFAMGMIEGGQELPFVVRWSNLADTGGIPNTWDEYDLAAVAGSVALPAEGGKVLCGLPLRDSFLVYSENAIHAFDFVGGQYVFNIRVVSNTIGCISNNAVVNHNGFHYFIDREDLYRTDGNTIESISQNKVRRALLQSLTPSALDRAFCFSSTVLDEVWFCIPSAGNVPNYALIFDVPNESFSSADLVENYSMATGYPAVVSLTWDNYPGSWAAATDAWAQAATSTGQEEVLLNYLQTTGNLPQLRRFLIYGGLANFKTEMRIVSGAVLPSGDPELICTCLQMTFVESSDFPFVIGISTSDTPYGVQSQYQEIVVPANGRRVQFRLTGRYFWFVFRSYQANNFAISSYIVDYVVDGQR